MSPSSMLIPRRGQSPARGLAKPNDSVKERRDAPDNDYPSDARENYGDRFREAGWERHPRVDARERGISYKTNGRTDHYSPPPEDDRERSKHATSGYFGVEFSILLTISLIGHRSISPHRKSAMPVNQR